MGKGSPKAPAAPDPVQTAQAQAQANRLNQFFPGGGSLLYGRYNSDGSFSPDYSHDAVQLQESPYQNQSRQLGERLSLQLASLLGGNINLPQMQSTLNLNAISRVPSINDFSNDATRVEQATYQRMSDLLRPEFDKRRLKQQQNLANQGIPLGSEAYSKEFDNLSKNENEALQAAAQDAVSAGRAEQQRLFSNAIAAHQSQLGDQLQSIGLNNNARSAMLQELASLLGGQQFTPGQFSGGIASPSVNVSDNVYNTYQGQLSAYNNRVAQQRQSMQSIFGLGGGLFGLL